MSTTSTIPQQDQRETLILLYLAHVKGMLRNYARSAQMEFEDMQQDAALTIMHCLDTRPQEEAGRLHGYINRSVRNRLIDRIRQQKMTLSLDTPLPPSDHNDEGSDATTFADLLESSDLEPLSLLLLQEQLAAFQTWLQYHKTTRGTLRRQLWLSWQRFLKEEGQAA